MKILITGASRHGSTREIADAIAEELRTTGLAADVRDAASVTSLDGYDAVFIGSAIYMGGWMPEARHLIDRCETPLRERAVWLFSSGPLGNDDPQPAGEPAQIAEILQRTNARQHQVFAGKLDRDALGFGERMIARMVHAPDGDFRDWDAIRDWARQIAKALNAMSPTPAIDL